MILAIHGQSGGWDELIIAAVALVVLWVAVKLAGRKSSDDDDDDDASADGEKDKNGNMAPDGTGADGEADHDMEHRDPARRPMDKVR